MWREREHGGRECFVQFGPPGLAAYQLPGGAIAMQFIPNRSGLTPSPDGLGGFFLEWNLGTNDTAGDRDFSIFRRWL